MQNLGGHPGGELQLLLGQVVPGPLHGLGVRVRAVGQAADHQGGELVPGSGLENHKPDLGRRDQLARKQEKKLGNMADQRSATFVKSDIPGQVLTVQHHFAS